MEDDEDAKFYRLHQATLTFIFSPFIRTVQETVAGVCVFDRLLPVTGVWAGPGGLYMLYFKVHTQHKKLLTAAGDHCDLELQLDVGAVQSENNVFGH